MDKLSFLFTVLFSSSWFFIILIFSSTTPTEWQDQEWEMKLKFHHLPPIDTFTVTVTSHYLLKWGWGLLKWEGVTCVFCSPVFILSFIVDNWELAVAFFLNGNISMFMLFGTKGCLGSSTLFLKTQTVREPQTPGLSGTWVSFHL